VSDMEQGQMKRMSSVYDGWRCSNDLGDDEIGRMATLPEPPCPTDITVLKNDKIGRYRELHWRR
jgi:hypothetical protein